MTFFSIVIPVYNISSYLDDAVGSILRQRFKDFELILVDDGSTDGSEHICNLYASNHDYVKVIHKANGGPSSARNAGIRAARGEYLVFLDGDDVLCENALHEMYLAVLEYGRPDLILGTVIQWSHRSQRHTRNDRYRMMQKSMHLMDICVEYTKNGELPPWAPYSTIYNLNYLRRLRICYEERWNCAEDCAFFMSLVLENPSFVLVGFPFVKVRIDRGGSITRQLTYWAIRSQLEAFAFVFDSCKKKMAPQELQSFFAQCFMNVMNQVGMLNDDSEFHDCMALVRERSDILASVPQSIRNIIMRDICVILGMERGIRCLGKVRRVIRGTGL